MKIIDIWKWNFLLNEEIISDYRSKFYSINDNKGLKIYVGDRNAHLLYLWLIMYFLENVNKSENYGVNPTKSSYQLKSCDIVQDEWWPLWL